MVTKHVAETIKDTLDNLRDTQQISENVWSKLQSQSRLLEAINNADIEVCRLVKQQQQMIAYIPKDTREVLLESLGTDTSLDTAITSQLSVWGSIIESKTNTVFLNRDWYVDASNIVGEYISVYSSVPIGENKVSSYIKVMNNAMFEDNDSDEPYWDHIHGYSTKGYFEPNTKRLRLASSFGSDMFFSWIAYLIPAKVDATTLTSWTDYTIRSPYYAQGLLVSNALLQIVPLGTNASNAIYQEHARQVQNVFSFIPTDMSIKQVTRGYIG